MSERSTSTAWACLPIHLWPWHSRQDCHSSITLTGTGAGAETAALAWAAHHKVSVEQQWKWCKAWCHAHTSSVMRAHYSSPAQLTTYNHSQLFGSNGRPWQDRTANLCRIWLQVGTRSKQQKPRGRCQEYRTITNQHKTAANEHCQHICCSDAHTRHQSIADVMHMKAMTALHCLRQQAMQQLAHKHETYAYITSGTAAVSASRPLCLHHPW